MAASPAYANPAGNPPSPPVDTGSVAPVPTPNFRPLGDGPKNRFLGGAIGIFLTKLKNGNFDFYLGLSFAFVLVIGGIIINQPRPSQLINNEF